MDSNLLDFMDSLKKALGKNLKSFVVYGSAAAGDLYKKSDYNTLIVTDEIDLAELDKISPQIRKWVKKGNPIPLIFTDHSLVRSGDVFPMEFMDIKENSITLYGSNYFKKMKVPAGHLRLETERELKSTLLKLIRMYAVTAGRPKDMKRAMRDTVSGVLSVFKAVLRLYRLKVPAKKADVPAAMPKKLKVDAELFGKILMLKQGKDDIKDAPGVFHEYIECIERISEAVDKL